MLSMGKRAFVQLTTIITYGKLNMINVRNVAYRGECFEPKIESVYT